MSDLKRISVLMATVFVDMVGFFVVLPLLPFYAERFGADASAVGALVSTFAFAQVTTAPIWGKLSDRLGRRPVILSGLVVSALAYVVFGLAGSVAMLFLSRFVQGAGGGTVGVIQAYVSDSVPPEERAKGLGWLTAAASLGVTVGPAVGSLATRLGPAAPGFVAAGLCLLNLGFAWRWLPEPPAEEAEEEVKEEDGREGGKGRVRRAMLEVVRRPRAPVSALIWIYAAAMMAFMAMNGVIALYLERSFGVTEETIGWLYVWVGFISVVMRTFALGPLVRRFGEIRLLRAGAVLVALGMAAIPLPGDLWTLALAVAVVPIGTALLFPATTSQVSHRSPAGRTGLMLGVQQSFGGVARMIGPAWAGAVFEHVGIREPFWLAGGVMLGVFLFAVGSVREVERGEGEEGEDGGAEVVEAPLGGEVP